MNYFKKTNCAVILIILILNLLFPIISAATDTTVSIQFEDVNLYNAIVQNTSIEISNKTDSTHTIQITKSNLDSVDTLHLYEKNIQKLNGLENFKNVAYLDLHGNNITDISSLRNLTNLTTLRIFENNITDISAISNLTKLENLEIENNKINNISALTNLKKLVYLSIHSNNLRDISTLSTLTNLRYLYLGNNNISDVSSLANLVNLEELFLNENNMSNITSLKKLENLPKLKKLDLVGNHITDINPLSNFTNLENLYIGYNNITDIKPLENLRQLVFLGLDFNNITDITPLQNLTKLTSLNLSNNKITNINALANIKSSCKVSVNGNKINDLKILDINSNIDLNGVTKQYLSITTKAKEVQLPKIFIQAQDKNSKLYTSNELVLVNCKLNTDKTKVILDDNIKEATVTIKGGKISGSKLTITYNDEEAPILNIKYSTTEITKDPITVTITAHERVKKVEGWTLSEDGTTLSKVYTKNTTEKVKVYDLVGNETEANISIKNIDKTVQAEKDKPSTPNEVPKTDKTVAPNKIPQTGQSGWIVSSITLVIVIIAILVVKYKKYKDIK